MPTLGLIILLAVLGAFIYAATWIIVNNAKPKTSVSARVMAIQGSRFISFERQRRSRKK